MPSTLKSGKAASSTATVSALERGIAVLRCFDEHVESLSNTELSALTGVPRPTVTRLAATLVAQGLLKQDPETERFSLGPGVVALARAFLAHLDIRAIARPFMRELADSLGGSSYLAVCDDVDMVLIEIVRSRASALRPNHELGTRIKLAGSSLGGAYLSVLQDIDPAGYRQLLARLQQHAGANWPAQAEQVEDARRQYERNGYCVSLGGVSAEINSVAVPIRAGYSAPMALNVGGPAFTFTEAYLHEKVAPALLRAVQAIGTQTGAS